MKLKQDITLSFSVCARVLLVSLLFAQTPEGWFSLPISLASEYSQGDLCSQAQLRIVKILLSKNTWGSGALIHRNSNQYTLVTNAHVLHGNKKQYTIQTSDDQKHQADVIARFDQNKDSGTDIAVMKFVSPSNYKVFSLSKWIQGEKVIGAGFPVNLTAATSEKFLCTQFGKAYSLDKPMKKGYQLGFDLSISSGMSGGPLINSHGELVGINGMGDPLIFVNPDIYRFRDNTKVSEKLSKQWNVAPNEVLKHLSSSSWAIPSETVTDLLQSSLNISLRLSSNVSPDENKEQINPVSNKPLPTIAPTPLATNTVITSISPKDIAKKVAVSVGLGTKQNGRIIIDPTSTGVIIGKRNKTYYVLTREKDIYDNQRYGITTPDKQNYLAKISWKKADLDLAILEFESTLTYDITSIGNVDKLNTALNIYIYGWTMSNGIRTPVLSEGLLRDVSKNFIYESRSIITLGSGIILNTDGQLIGLHKGFSSDGKTGRAISIQKFLHSIPFNIGLASPLQKEIMQSPCISTLFGNCAK